VAPTYTIFSPQENICVDRLKKFWDSRQLISTVLWGKNYGQLF